jgi:hypothetical protein
MTAAREIVVLLPRLVRLRDAPGYLGMDRNRFNADMFPVWQFAVRYCSHLQGCTVRNHGREAA